MTPIQNKDTFTANGNKQVTLTIDPFCFMLNTIAMGDVIAAVPVIKYMVDNYYTNPEYYRVVAKPYFRPLFPFVPDSNFIDFDKKDNLWGIPAGFAIGVLNKKKETGQTRNTPKHMHLSQFASLVLSDRVIPKEQLNYVSLDEVDVSRFNVDFRNTVILVTSYRDVTRMWRPEYILAIAKWLISKDVVPVFIGKTDMDLNMRQDIIPKNSLPNDVSEYGVDLRNRTSIAELASIFRQARAVCGLDSGPVHIAGTTDIPIVCGYTSVAAEHRIPYRLKGNTYAIAPEIECIGCESRWRSNFWNYEQCFYGHANCCSLMTPDRFINVLNTILF